METMLIRRQAGTTPLGFVGGVVLVLIVTLGAFYLIVRPPMAEMAPLALFLSITAVISVATGFGAYRLGWINHSPHISWTLVSGYALSTLVIFLNVWVTARLMFASQHDLTLATMLLLFAGGIAVSLGYFLSAAVTNTIVELDQAAKGIAEGDLSARVPVAGKDEMAELACTFNAMAEQLEASARKQQELDEMRRNLIAWIGHDLRTPLASIRAVVEALADGVVEEPVTVQRYLRTAKRDIQSLSLLIDDLFQMAQLDAGGLQLDRQANSIADLISDTIESFSEAAARKEIVLEGAAAPDSDPVHMDVQRIGRVLANLVDNALRHTPAGGTVRVQAFAKPEEVQIEVRDTGEGIDPEDIPHIFEQFYRGEKSRSRATGGAGLGLAIARGIVQAHDGRIWVSSEAGGGACFTFVLPRGVEPRSR